MKETMAQTGENLDLDRAEHLRNKILQRQQDFVDTPEANEIAATLIKVSEIIDELKLRKRRAATRRI